MTETERGEYYRTLTDWVESPGYKIEYEGELMELYEEIASKAQNELAMAAYRLAMLRTKTRDLRLKDKVKLYNAQRAFQTTQRNIR